MRVSGSPEETKGASQTSKVGSPIQDRTFLSIKWVVIVKALEASRARLNHLGSFSG